MLLRLPVLKQSARLRYITYFYLYAMQGIPAGFAITALANYFTGKGVSSTTIGGFDALIGLPWIFQFVWGPLIDRYQFSLMGHRKQWIVFSEVAALLISLSLLLVKDPVKQVTLVGWIFFFHSIFASVQDASVDASAIAITPVNEQGRLNAFMRSGWILGLGIGAAGLSTILHLYGFYYAAACQSFILLLFTVATYITKTDRADSYRPSLTTTIKHHTKTEPLNPDILWIFRRLFKGIIQKKSLRAFGMIILVYLCLDVYIRSLPFELIHYLHWNDNQLSVLQGTWGSIITIVITLSGGFIADKMGAGRLQTIVTMGICIYFIVFNGLGMYWSHKAVSVPGLLTDSMADPLFSVAAMPVLMALCLKNVEGSQFTTYMAIVNLADVGGSYIFGWAMKVTRAPVVGFTCGIIILAALAAQHLWRTRPSLRLLKSH